MPFDANDPETKEALAAAIAEAVGKLESKNRELLTELRKAKKGAEVDPADVERLEAELDAARTQLADANKALKTATKQAEDDRKALEGERGFVSSLLVDNGLTAALTEAGVKNPAHLKAAAALLKSSAKVEVAADDTGARRALVDGKPLGDFVKTWAASDDGKAFVAAPANSGGGAAGGTKPGAGAVKGDMGGDTAARHARINEMKAQAGITE